MSDEYLPQKVMSIHAHPDDQEFTVAGTLAKWVSSRVRGDLGRHHQRRRGVQRPGA